jgi:NADPH:quinone reductase-like Zn-dependent oxidoreductase
MPRRVLIPRFGDVGVLEVEDAPASPLTPGSVRIRVRAAGVNFADLLMRMGLYRGAPPLPFVPGYEIAGTVEELDPEAARARPDLAVGARVAAGTRFGGYAEDVVVPVTKVIPMPADWSFEEAAGFPVVYITAWMALRAMARVREGDRVLVHGIAGGVGLAALQIARAAGACVAGTCGGAEKTKAARAAGVDLAIDYRAQDVSAEVRAWAPDGVDAILEPRGGRGLRESLHLLRPTGRVVLYGVSEIATGRRRNLIHAARAVLPLLRLDPLRLVQENKGVFGLNVLELWHRDDLFAAALEDLLRGVREGRLRTVLDRAFPLERAADAHRYLHERRNVGKVVLTTGGGGLPA